MERFDSWLESTFFRVNDRGDLDTRGVKLFGKDRWGTRLLGPWDRWGVRKGDTGAKCCAVCNCPSTLLNSQCERNPLAARGILSHRGLSRSPPSQTAYHSFKRIRWPWSHGRPTQAAGRTWVTWWTIGWANQQVAWVSWTTISGRSTLTPIWPTSVEGRTHRCKTWTATTPPTAHGSTRPSVMPARLPSLARLPSAKPLLLANHGLCLANQQNHTRTRPCGWPRPRCPVASSSSPNLVPSTSNTGRKVRRAPSRRLHRARTPALRSRVGQHARPTSGHSSSQRGQRRT